MENRKSLQFIIDNGHEIGLHFDPNDVRISAKIIFWAAVSLEEISRLEKYQCGEVIKYYHIDNQLVIKTGNSALLVSDYEFSPNSSTSSIKEEAVLKSVDFFKQCNEIFNRHYSKNPDKPIQEKIVKYAESHRKKQ